MKAVRFLHVSMNVPDLSAAEAFYRDALGFSRVGDPRGVSGAMRGLLGLSTASRILLRRGRQTLELMASEEARRASNGTVQCNDVKFQHIAIVTRDIGSAFRRLRSFNASPITLDGPQTHPGGIIAYKFRDPYGHPLELIQFPRVPVLTDEGIDHSAIVVADVARSIAFYRQQLSMEVAGRQTNLGLAQDRLDALDQTEVEVVALEPQSPAPHLELLGYTSSVQRKPAIFSDISTRSVFLVEGLNEEINAIRVEEGVLALLKKDPDGHALLLLSYDESPSDVENLWMRDASGRAR